MATQNLTVAQYLAGPSIDPADDILIVDTGEKIAELTEAQITGLAAAKVIGLDATDDVLALNNLQFKALGTVALTEADDVSLADTGAVLSNLAPEEINVLATANVDRIDATDDAFAVGVLQLVALQTQGVKLTDTDSVTLAEFGAVLSGAGPDLIAPLGPFGIDFIDALVDDLTYSIAGVQALGTVQLTDGSVVKVQRHG